MLTKTTVTILGGPAQDVFRGGKGTPLVWLHGVNRIGADDSVLAALAERHEVIAPQTPGYRDLNEITELRDIHDLALHYDTLLETLGLDHVALAGHSFGGMIAAEVAAHVPKRVSKLVLVSPLGLWNDAYPVADLVARPLVKVEELMWQGAVHRPEQKVEAEKSREEKIEHLVALASGLASVGKYTWPIPDKGLRRRLHRISAPTLLVFGEHDAFVPARYAEDFASGIAHAKATTVPGSHMSPYEQPAELARMIAEFLG